MNDMAKLIKEYRKARSEMNAIANKPQKRIEEVAKRVLLSGEGLKEGYGNPSKPDVHFNWSISGSEVVCNWMERWGHGGHDGGTFRFTIQFLYDEDALVQFEAEEKHKFLEKQRRIETAQRNEREAEYNELKKEFGKE